MRILFDNGTPRGVAAAFPDYTVEEARSLGYAQVGSSIGGIVVGQIKNCPECEKKGASVAMKKRKSAKPEGPGAMFVADDLWVCPAVQLRRNG